MRALAAIFWQAFEQGRRIDVLSKRHEVDGVALDVTRVLKDRTMILGLRTRL
jgi:hypothetical protein